mgnify:CR=1 FL=1
MNMFSYQSLFCHKASAQIGIKWWLRQPFYIFFLSILLYNIDLSLKKRSNLCEPLLISFSNFIILLLPANVKRKREALTCANWNNSLPQSDVQRHHHGKAEHCTPCAKMRMFWKVCVGNEVFHDDEYHCAYANATFLFDKIMLIATSTKPISNKTVKQVLFLPAKILFMKLFPLGKFRYSRVYLRWFRRKNFRKYVNIPPAIFGCKVY